MAWTHFLQQTTSLIPRGALPPLPPTHTHITIKFFQFFSLSWVIFKLHDDVSKAIKNGKKVSKQNDILFNTSAVFFSFSVIGIYWT
jgi:hypothetical protein